MTAEILAKALGGRKTGCTWMARCPAHDDRVPSLSVSNGNGGKILVCCHAGCDQIEVIRALQMRGLWGTRSSCRIQASVRQSVAGRRNERGEADRTRAALDVWRTSSLALETPAATYLRSRGINLPVPMSLRFHAGLKHPAQGCWPAMVALVTHGRSSAPLAIHRTFIEPDGSGKAPVEPTKMMLGPCRGGAVRLGTVDEVLMVGEGIETCLAAMQATGRPAWAALSTSGLRALGLPDTVRDVIVLADGDDPGEAAAQVAATRWKREGRQVRIARPPQGLDFNDMLVGRMPLVQGAVR